MPNETDLYAISKQGRKLMKFSNVQSITYGDVVVYDGRVYSNEFDISNALSGNGYLTGTSGTEVAPDSVKKEAPKVEASKFSAVTLTCTKGVGTVDIVLRRDQLVAGALTNVNPFSPTVTSNGFYAWTTGGLLIPWHLVESLARSDEEVYEGETYRHDFDMSGALAGKGYLDYPDVLTKVSPDSIAGTAPRYLKRQRSIITITVTHDAGTLALRVFRDELRGWDLMNADPAA